MSTHIKYPEKQECNHSPDWHMASGNAPERSKRRKLRSLQICSVAKQTFFLPFNLKINHKWVLKVNLLYFLKQHRKRCSKKRLKKSLRHLWCSTVQIRWTNQKAKRSMDRAVHKSHWSLAASTGRKWALPALAWLWFETRAAQTTLNWRNRRKG